MDLDLINYPTPLASNTECLKASWASYLTQYTYLLILQLSLRLLCWTVPEYTWYCIVTWSTQHQTIISLVSDQELWCWPDHDIISINLIGISWSDVKNIHHLSHFTTYVVKVSSQMSRSRLILLSTCIMMRRQSLFRLPVSTIFFQTLFLRWDIYTRFDTSS